MTRIARLRGAGGNGEDGVILVLFSVAMVVLIGIAAIAVDGSFGFVQNRRAQNATDFAAFAASQQLNTSTYCSGTATPSTQDIAAIVQELINRNDAGVSNNWSAQFLGNNGQPILDGNGQPVSFSPGRTSGTPPPGACGVSITAKPVWAPFFAGIFGVHQLKGYASGSVANTPSGNPIGIVALNKVGPHEILGGGTGTFVISGNIFLNTDVSHQPWTSSVSGWQWDDAVDAKADSNLYVYGTIATNNGTYGGEPLWPLDHCFQPTIVGDLQPGETSPSNVAYSGGNPATSPPTYVGKCSEGSVTVDYNAIAPNFAQIDDPLSGSGAPANPLSAATNIACPGMATQYYGPGTVSASASNVTLEPGVYTSPVEITGNATFADCSGYSGEAAYPGIYRFEAGLWINPKSSNDTVRGSNVVIATQAPYPLGGNTFNGTATPGNGAPCLPAGTKASSVNGGQSEVTSNACGATSPQAYGVVAYGDSSIAVDPSMSGTGTNFSLMIGGSGTVDLTGPTTGAYAGTNGTPGLVLYQDPNTQANYGFDAEAGDSASVDITGVVYNASLTNYGSTAPLDYWDGSGGGVPFYAGGTLQTGYGTGWSGPAAPAQSTGSVTLDGTAIVEDFNTDGATTITILGQPYTLPGGAKLSLIG
jgi:type II secretory pathway pseudopilin PulG